MRSSTLRHASHEPRRLAARLVGLLAGPLVWLTLLETNYVLTYVACEQRREWMLHAASFVALVVVALAGLAAWQARSTGPTEAPTVNQDATSELHGRFLAYGGVLMSLWFIIVIVATEIPVIIYQPCQ